MLRGGSYLWLIVLFRLQLSPFLLGFFRQGDARIRSSDATFIRLEYEFLSRPLLVALSVFIDSLACVNRLLLNSLQQGLILHVDSGVLATDSVDHLALTLDLQDLSRVSLGEGMGHIDLVSHIHGVVLMQPTDSGCLDPSAWLWLHFLSCLVLHE